MTIILGLSVLGLSIASMGCLLRWRQSRKWIKLQNEQLNLQNKLFIITGGNCGIGFETALQLAKQKASLVLACRNETSGFEAVQQIKNLTGNNQIFYENLDLGSLNSIQETCNRIINKYNSIYCVICNAGVWVPMSQKLKTINGFEIHFGTNHLGHFALIQRLLIHYKDIHRVVLVSSLLMKYGVIDMDSKDFIVNGRNSSSRIPSGYADSKLMNGLFAKELCERYDIQALSVCPGWCKSNLARHVKMPFWKKLLFWPITFFFMRTAKQGSYNVLFCSLEEELENGGFYRDGKIASEEFKKIVSLKETSTQLWDLSLSLINNID